MAQSQIEPFSSRRDSDGGNSRVETLTPEHDHQSETLWQSGIDHQEPTIVLGMVASYSRAQEYGAWT